MLTQRKHRVKGGLMGAAAGIVAGSVAAGVYEHVVEEEKLPYYSEFSPLYDEIEDSLRQDGMESHKV